MIGGPPGQHATVRLDPSQCPGWVNPDPVQAEQRSPRGKAPGGGNISEYIPKNTDAECEGAPLVEIPHQDGRAGTCAPDEGSDATGLNPPFLEPPPEMGYQDPDGMAAGDQGSGNHPPRLAPRHADIVELELNTLNPTEQSVTELGVRSSESDSVLH